MSFKQSPHKLLVIPGPIEVTDEVLYANAAPSVSHISPDFIKLFGDSIRMTREVLFTKTGQPFLISGSGTLGWDQVASNLIEPGEYALVLHSGYFGDSFAECLSTYGAHVDVLKAPTGSVVDQEVLREKLKTRPYRLVAFTHVDTSTGVLSPAKLIAQTVRSVSRNILVVADAVCSVGSEEIKFDEWKLDVVLTASQKGLGTPPGLSILVASDKALDVFYHRRTKVTSYYASWKKWLPIMQAYEAGQAAYFATPPVNLINSYHASLLQLTRNPNLSMEERFKRHIEASNKVKNALKELGLQQIAQKEEWAANGMTTVYYPPGVGASDIIPRFAQRGVVVAGGLLKEIKDSYFRIGHMGVTAVDEERGDLERILSALRESVQEAKASKKN